MTYIIDNSQFRNLKTPDLTPVFPERFTREGSTASFELVSDTEHFSWNGIKGECYEAHAPLDSELWPDSFREAFARWRCAVFTPDAFDPKRGIKPVVFTFTGITGDYNDTALFLHAIVEKLGCIMVAFDTHLTGKRVLTKDKQPKNDKFYESLDIMEKSGHPMTDNFFRAVIEEIAFNVQQTLCLLKQRFEWDDMPPFLTLGFSLGGFYASQIARLVPRCTGCVAGAASPEIMNYGGIIYTAARIIPDFVLKGAQRLLKGDAANLVKLGVALKRVTRTPFTGMPVGGTLTPFRFVIGTKDEVVNYKTFPPADGCDFSLMQAIVIQNGRHVPCTGDGEFTEVGQEMVNQVIYCLDRYAHS